MRSRLSRLPFAIILLLLCFLAGRSAWDVGAARLLSKSARDTLVGGQADRAVGISPSDPETHSTRGVVLYNSNDVGGALEEFERAAALRPRDYFLWLQLGRARDEAGDKEGALLALRESVKFAPYYSEPRWQYGNVLYRLGRFDEAFRELRLAAESDPALFPVLIDLAWGTYRGDAQAVESVARPQTDKMRLALARFFVKKGKAGEALALFHAAGEIPEGERASLLDELIKAKQFKAAYAVWAAGRNVGGDPRSGGAARINEPSFEGRINLSEPGFGWQQERGLEGVRLSLDTKGAGTVSRCLLIEWDGNSKPTSLIISQLVLVEPNARYRLSFVARTESVVTGGPPMISVNDAGSDGARVLARSKALPQDAPEWREYEVGFNTAGTTEAVLISVQRQDCAYSPCPIFGRVWLDDFSLRKV